MLCSFPRVRSSGADDPGRPRPPGPNDKKDEAAIVRMRPDRDVAMFLCAVVFVGILEVEDVGPVVPEDLRRGPERDLVFLAVSLFLRARPSKIGRGTAPSRALGSISLYPLKATKRGRQPRRDRPRFARRRGHHPAGEAASSARTGRGRPGVGDPLGLALGDAVAAILGDPGGRLGLVLGARPPPDSPAPRAGVFSPGSAAKATTIVQISRK